MSDPNVDNKTIHVLGSDYELMSHYISHNNSYYVEVSTVIGDFRYTYPFYSRANFGSDSCDAGIAEAFLTIGAAFSGNFDVDKKLIKREVTK